MKDMQGKGTMCINTDNVRTKFQMRKYNIGRAKVEVP